MTAQTFQPIAARPAPNKSEGPVAWIRINLFSDVFTSLLTLVVGGGLLYVIPQLLSWAIFRASWVPDFVVSCVRTVNCVDRRRIEFWTCH